MSTQILLKCNFCGMSDTVVKVNDMKFMGDVMDFHICEKCTNVVGNLLFEVSIICQEEARINLPHCGDTALAKIVERLNDKFKTYATIS